MPRCDATVPSGGPTRRSDQCSVYHFNLRPSQLCGMARARRSQAGSLSLPRADPTGERKNLRLREMWPPSCGLVLTRRGELNLEMEMNENETLMSESDSDSDSEARGWSERAKVGSQPFRLPGRMWVWCGLRPVLNRVLYLKQRALGGSGGVVYRLLRCASDSWISLISIVGVLCTIQAHTVRAPCNKSDSDYPTVRLERMNNVALVLCLANIRISSGEQQAGRESSGQCRIQIGINIWLAPGSFELIIGAIQFNSGPCSF